MRGAIILILGLIILAWVIGFALKVVSAIFNVILGAVVVLALLVWWALRKRNAARSGS